MIPKIIHICWLSGDEFPQDIRTCLESWKVHLADYKIWLWGKKPVDCLGLNVIEKSFDLSGNKWCKQAFEAKKYAFAADYIRLYALYNYGGIYLDSDVLMYKSFNDLLNLPYFLGEDMVHCFEPAIIGAEKSIPWVKDVLNRYDGLSFINQDGSYNMKSLPVVFLDRLKPKYKFSLAKRYNDFVDSDSIINIFPSAWFNSRNYLKSVKRKDAYCSHCFAGSWLKKKNGMNWKRVVPDLVLNILLGFMYYTIYKKHLNSIQINYIHVDRTN